MCICNSTNRIEVIIVAKQRILRPLADGSFSYCTASDDRIGKGRCCHVTGQCICMEQERIGKKKFVQEVTLETYTSMSKSEKVDSICKTLGTMKKITPAQRDKILKSLESVKVKKNK